jgi:hypothetical protein
LVPSSRAGVDELDLAAVLGGLVVGELLTDASVEDVGVTVGGDVVGV